MTEVELNALFNISPERADNVYSVESQKSIEEIRRIVKIFSIAKEQKSPSRILGARGLAAFRTILTSNN